MTVYKQNLIANQGQQQGRHYPEYDALTRDGARIGARGAGRADLGYEIEPAKRQTNKEQREADKNGAKRCKRREATDPGSADAQCEQRQWPTQHTDATIAASPPAAKGIFAVG